MIMCIIISHFEFETHHSSLITLHPSPVTKADKNEHGSYSGSDY